MWLYYDGNRKTVRFASASLANSVSEPANSYGRLSTLYFNRVHPDDNNSLGLLDHSGNPREFVG